MSHDSSIGNNSGRLSNIAQMQQNEQNNIGQVDLQEHNINNQNMRFNN